MISILNFTSKLNYKIESYKDFNFSLININNTTRKYEKYVLNLLFNEGKKINAENDGENPLEESKYKKEIRELFLK